MLKSGPASLRWSLNQWKVRVALMVVSNSCALYLRERKGRVLLILEILDGPGRTKTGHALAQGRPLTRMRSIGTIRAPSCSQQPQIWITPHWESMPQIWSRQLALEA